MKIYLRQDKIYKLPRVVVNLILYIPEVINSPTKRADIQFITTLCIEKVSKEVGFEATLADFSYSFKVFENLGLKIKFTGYDDKLIVFADKFL